MKGFQKIPARECRRYGQEACKREIVRRCVYGKDQNACQVINNYLKGK